MDYTVQSKSPTYQGIYSLPNYEETKLCIVIDSKMPTLMKIPVAPGKLTLGHFKSYTSLDKSYYKFYFKSQDSLLGPVREELVEDDVILPVEDGKIVAWVISNESFQSTLFEPEKKPTGLEPLPDEVDHYRMSRHSPVSIYNNHFTLQSDHYNSNNKHNQEHIYDRMLVDHQSTTCITANLFLDSNNSLGLTVLCPSDELNYTGGIFIDKVQPNSLASRDDRIKAGDMIVEINGFNLRGSRASEAVTIFKQFVDRRGAINLVLQRQATCLHQSRIFDYRTNHEHPPRVKPKLHPRSSSVGFDPATELPAPVIEPADQPSLIPSPDRAAPKFNNYRATYSLPRSMTPRSLYTTSNLDNLTSSSDLRYPLDSRSVYEPTTPNSARQINVALHCGKDNIYTIYAHLKSDAASLDIKDRDWLKVIVKDAFLGSTLIKWLRRNVYGFCNRSEVKRFANQMLSLGLIKSPMSNATFSEKCYYILT